MSGIRLSMRVWDAPTRLFHWAIVLLLCFSWFTAETERMQLHFLSGEAILVLLIFRVAWGFTGSETSRFRNFLTSPIAGLRHLSGIARREPDNEIGHNAAGGWMVLVLLALLAAQVCTGLFSNHDDLVNQGPLADHVSKELSDRISAWHHLNFNLILAAVALHVLAVLTYAVLKRQDLVRPMVTGKKRMPAAMRAPRMASSLLALALLVMAAMITWVITTL